MSKKSSIVVEGVTDRAIFESLLRKLNLATVVRPKKLPCDRIEFAEFEINEGSSKDGAIELFQTRMKDALARPMLFLAVDLDFMKREEPFKQIDAVLEHEGVEGKYDIGESRGTVIPLGLEAIRKEWELDKLAIDDYILSLATDEAVFEGLRRQAERHGPKINLTHEKAMHKMREVMSLMKGQGLPLAQSKAHLEILRGVTGYVVSPAVFAERVIANCPDENLLRSTFKNVLGALSQI
jgi:hypothetical protein